MCKKNIFHFLFLSNQKNNSKLLNYRLSGTKLNSGKNRDFTQFCIDFKQRYLYVCPDPLRFGKKAVVFCPLYAEKCQVALPEKPMVPPSQRTRQEARASIARLCAQNYKFARNYCRNNILRQYPQYRDACMKYKYFCMHKPRV
ncbi:unnamed protein product [Thelazia callipaeda]|uniref:Uncharacterized protein n=1 Tax=Thelazia callipaeda TaxID=103827 RepID=A0A0N5CLB7_THECL|nr:unnamed protein product [Thelazia callipaeda]